jgi:hypothetical protein
VTPRLPLSPHPCNPFALVASPKLGLRQKQKTIIEILQKLKERTKELLIDNNNASQKQVNMLLKEHQTPLGSIAKTQAPKLGSHQPCIFTLFKK